MPHVSLSQFSRDGQLIASVLNDDQDLAQHSISNNWLSKISQLLDEKLHSTDKNVIFSATPADHGKAIAVTIISSRDSKELWRINLSPSETTPDSMTFSESDGKTRLLAIARSNHGVGVWRLNIGEPAVLLRELSNQEHGCEHTKRVPSLAFHPSKPWIVTSSEDQRLCLWDYSQQPAQLVWEQENTHDTAVHGIAFNEQGSLLASGGGDYLAKLWQTSDMSAGYDGHSSHPNHPVKPIKTMRGHTDSVFAVAFSPDGQRLASGGYDRIIRIWQFDLGNKEEQATILTKLSGHEGTVMDISFSKDSKLLISGGKDKTARVWDASEGRILATLTPENGNIRSVAWQGFEHNLYLGGDNGWSIWSQSNNKLIRRLWNGGATIGTIAFDPAGHFLAAAGDDGKVRIWDNESHNPQVLDSGLVGESINGLAISSINSGSQWLAAAGEGKTIHLWQHESIGNSWKKVIFADGDALKHDGAIWGLCFDPNGKWLYSSNTSDNKRIKRWAMNDWSLKDQSTKLDDSVYSLACDIGGNRLISGDSIGKIKVWETGQLTVKSEIRNVQQGEVNVWSVAMSSNPPYIFSGNSDGHVYRWLPSDPEWIGGEKEKIGTSNEDAKANDTINSVSFNPTRGWVAAGGSGNSIELYDINLNHLQSLAGHDGAIWYVAFDPQGTHLAYGGSDRILRVFNLDELQNLKSASPEKLYHNAQEMTGLSVDEDKIIVGKLPE